MIEPSQAYTVQTSKPALPPEAPKGDGKIIVPYEENVYALLMKHGANIIRKRHGKPVEYATTEVQSLTDKQARYRARQAARTQETRQTILDALARPATAGDVAAHIKRDVHLTRRHLAIMSGLGLVEGHKCKNVVVWHRKGEA